MAAPTERARQSVILTGATGMIGGLVLSECLAHPRVGAVTTIGRRAVDRADPRLRQVIRTDFTDFEAVADALTGHDAAFFCLGSYTGAVPDAELRRTTVDYLVAFAKALFVGSPEAAFALLSGQGADQTGRSRFAFARYKGQAEAALLAIGFPKVYCFRPGYIYPVTPRVEPVRRYRIFRHLYPFLRLIYPNVGVSSVDLSRAMVRTALGDLPGEIGPTIENREIRALARSGDALA